MLKLRSCPKKYFIILLFCSIALNHDAILFAQQCAPENTIQLSKIISNPEKYNGKTVTLIGQYAIDLYCLYLKDDSGNSIMVYDNIVNSASLEDIQEFSGEQSCIRGVFKFTKDVSCLGCCDTFAISQIEFLKPLFERDDAKRIGFTLQGIILTSDTKPASFTDIGGKAYFAKEGTIFNGLLYKRLKSITKTKVVFEESIFSKKPKDTRQFEIILRKK